MDRTISKKGRRKDDALRSDDGMANCSPEESDHRK